VATIEDLKQSISTLSEDALLQHILGIRENRLKVEPPKKTAKPTTTKPKGKKKAKELDPFAVAQSLPQSLKDELIKELMNQMEE